MKGEGGLRKSHSRERLQNILAMPLLPFMLLKLQNSQEINLIQVEATSKARLSEVKVRGCGD